MKLVRPTVEFKGSFLYAVETITAECNAHFFKIPVGEENFQCYCDILIGYEKGVGLPEGYVPETILWLIDENNYIGNISIRHRLNDILLQTVGHIGYIIAPAHRKKGYGTKILELGLIEAEKLGIDKVLLTCDNKNRASKKIIERNNGVFENEVYSEDTRAWKQRYWIDLSK